jgi:hypothetical protein
VLEFDRLLLELLVGHLELGRLILELLVRELQLDGLLLQARRGVVGLGGVCGGRVPGRAQRGGERADQPGDEHEDAERDHVRRVGRLERPRGRDQVVVDPEHAQQRGREPGPDPAVPRGEDHGAERDDEECARDHRRQRDRECHGARREEGGRRVPGRGAGRGAGGRASTDAWAAWRAAGRAAHGAGRQAGHVALTRAPAVGPGAVRGASARTPARAGARSAAAHAATRAAGWTAQTCHLRPNESVTGRWAMAARGTGAGYGSGADARRAGAGRSHGERAGATSRRGTRRGKCPASRPTVGRPDAAGSGRGAVRHRTQGDVTTPRRPRARC